MNGLHVSGPRRMVPLGTEYSAGITKGALMRGVIDGEGVMVWYKVPHAAGAVVTLRDSQPTLFGILTEDYVAGPMEAEITMSATADTDMVMDASFTTAPTTEELLIISVVLDSVGIHLV